MATCCLMASRAPDLWCIGSNLVRASVPHDPLEPGLLRASFAWWATMLLPGTWGSLQRSSCAWRRYARGMYYLCLGSCQTAWLAAFPGSRQRDYWPSLDLLQFTGGSRFCKEMVCACVCTFVIVLAHLWAAYPRETAATPPSCEDRCIDQPLSSLTAWALGEIFILL